MKTNLCQVHNAVIIYGISGGNSEVGCNLGDVIVSEEIWDAEKYRVRYNGVDYSEEPNKYPISSYLNAVAINVNKANLWISKTRYLNSGISDPQIQSYSNSNTKIHFGITASSNVILDRLDIEPMYTLMDEPTKRIYGFEMEAKGLLRYIESLKTKDFMMIRGISDLPFLNETKQNLEFSSKRVNDHDAKKNYHSDIRDKWKLIALESAYIILMEILDTIDLRAYRRYKRQSDERPMPLPITTINADFKMDKESFLHSDGERNE